MVYCVVVLHNTYNHHVIVKYHRLRSCRSSDTEIRMCCIWSGYYKYRLALLSRTELKSQRTRHRLNKADGFKTRGVQCCARSSLEAGSRGPLRVRAAHLQCSVPRAEPFLWLSNSTQDPLDEFSAIKPKQLRILTKVVLSTLLYCKVYCL